MPIGGYRILDAKRNDVTARFTLKGAYNFIEETHNKPILFTNFLYNGVEQQPMWLSLRASGTSYISQFRLGADSTTQYKIVFRDDDSVSVPPLNEPVSDTNVEDEPSASI